MGVKKNVSLRNPGAKAQKLHGLAEKNTQASKNKCFRKTIPRLPETSRDVLTKREQASENENEPE